MCKVDAGAGKDNKKAHSTEMERADENFKKIFHQLSSAGKSLSKPVTALHLLSMEHDSFYSIIQKKEFVKGF